MRRKGVPGVVEIPLPQLRPIEGGVPDPAPEVVDVNMPAPNIREYELVSAGNFPLLLERPPDWRQDRKWSNAITRIAGKANGTMDVMDRKNPAWQGKILVEVMDSNGKQGWSLSSTRQTREAAFQYLCEVTGLKFEAQGRRRG